MPFPDADRAIVGRDKVCDYLLNRSHPIGGPKAEWFELLGYDRSNWQNLRDDLLEIARTCEDFVAVSSSFGVKYVTKGVIGRGDHHNTVLAVWMIETNSPPRLITAYPGDD